MSQSCGHLGYCHVGDLAFAVDDAPWLAHP